MTTFWCGECCEQVPIWHRCLTRERKADEFIDALDRYVTACIDAEREGNLYGDKDKRKELQDGLREIFRNVLSQP